MNLRPHLLAAIMAGSYIAAFYLSNNLTLIPASSIPAVAVALILPITAAVATCFYLLRGSRREAIANAATVFLCGLYLAVLLHTPIFALPSVRGLIAAMDRTTALLVKALYCIVPAALLALLFRRQLAKFALLMGLMVGGALLAKLPEIASTFTGNDGVYSREIAKVLRRVRLTHEPNIYFVMSDGYGSFAYMEENGIDVADFEQFLVDSDFRLYRDAFSNYQPTLAALPSLLNMDHHYYQSSYKRHEARKSERIAVAGRNNLVELLRRNGYRIEYVHESSYLLLQGCSADLCFPETPLAGARSLLGTITPTFFRLGVIKERISLEAVARKLSSLIDKTKPTDPPSFRYIHAFEPGHTPPEVKGSCDAASELGKYAERISRANSFLRSLLAEIRSRDPRAVIVLAGDHGPFIENSCLWVTDIDRLEEYRDRAGVLLAIRWPSEYDGRFDERIKTTVNVFRYLLAALMENDAEILSTAVSDDVFVRGDEGRIFRIMEDGELLVPPELHTKESLQAKYRGNATR